MGRLANAAAKIADLLGLPERVDNREGLLSDPQIKAWREEGFLLLSGFFPPERTEAIQRHIDELWARRRRPDNPLVIDVFVYTPRQKRIYLRDAEDEARDFPYKLNDLFMESEELRGFVMDERLAKIIGALLDGRPMVFNSLNFERGSQQAFHFDTFYMPPRAKNKMVASWIALEDIHPDAGPLAYYPGSHRIPPYHFSSGKLNAIPEEMPAFQKYIDAEIAKRGMKPVEFTPKRGDVFIWHAQLLHGGAPIKDMTRTRKSVVCHYFREREFPAWCAKPAGPAGSYFVRPHQAVDP